MFHILLLTSLLTSWSPNVFDHYYTNSFNLMSSPSSNCQIISTRSGFVDAPATLPYAEANSLIQNSKNHKRHLDIPISQFGYAPQLSFSNHSNSFLLPSNYKFFLLEFTKKLCIIFLLKKTNQFMF